MKSPLPLHGIVSLGLALCTILVCGRLPDVHAERSAQGIPVILLRSCTYEEAINRGDGRELVVQLKPDGSVFVNDNHVSSQELPALISHEMETRLVKVVYLVGDADIEYGRIAETAGQILREVPEMNFLFVTSSNLSSGGFCLVPEGPISGTAPEPPRKFATTMPIQ